MGGIVLVLILGEGSEWDLDRRCGGYVLGLWMDA